ncbi:MAG: hypothetical protein WCT27_04295 [Patescibacteria group bacterium]|jgi:hypothetical protein
MKLRTVITLVIGFIGLLFLANSFFAEPTYNPHESVKSTLKQIEFAEQVNRDRYEAYADLDAKASAGQVLPELNVKIPADSRYVFHIDEWKGVVTIRATANLDADSTIDTWAMSIGDRTIPICLVNDLDD